MKLNMNDFKKVKEDKHTIVLQHPRHGHHINIAKGSLSQKMKSDFAAMPMCNGGMYADGGQVEEPKKEEGFLDSIKNMISPPTDVTPVPEGNVDPQMQAKREMYNKEVSFPDLGPAKYLPPVEMATMVPRAISSLVHHGEQFGPNGEAPSRFQPEAWEEANKMYEREQSANTAKQNFDYQTAIKDNQARMSAGLPAQPLPQAPQGIQPASMNPNAEIAQPQPQPPQVGNDMAMLMIKLWPIT